MNILHWSPRSPYVRKVMVAIHEKGLTDEVETVRTLADPMVPPKDFFATNPLAKIPTLEREGAPPIWDSRVVMEWADLTSETGPRLFPADPETRLQALTDEALGTGMIEVGMALLIERHLRDSKRQDPRVFDVCTTKFTATLDYLEGHAARLEARAFDAGHLSVGVALCYLDFRFGDLEWRKGREALAAWHEGFAARPSVVATEFRDDPRPAD
ncbi:glutathione S-transferase family protein [Salipiger sp. P9]|uniref:glutathione S-transferase family protein n=1 Tax=Salipiger pentaromativorans TaxID=2943193 RepID=UPI0021580804|nr:glutathione S-transferase family protein [Salipiger pentaromativorans]MCR8551026.1 glutathione S-transferase family protein [Salipiger pentaromativorans]